MQIRVLAFATARDALGADEMTFSLPEGATVADLRDLLVEQYPPFEALFPRLAVAVGGEFAGLDRQIPSGAEVALLPPVSGGAVRGWITEDVLDLEVLAKTFEDSSSGALVLFVGRVRDHHQGRGVERIAYSGYRPMAAQILDRIAAELEASSDGLKVRLVHRLGLIEIGEASVVILTSSPHREAAYEANREALERIKKEVPIWKEEFYTDGTSTYREEEKLLGVGDVQLTPETALS